MKFADMKITENESETLDQCYAALDPLEAAEIEQEAFELAAEEIFSVEAAAILVPLLVKIIVRNIQERGGAR
jgi:hypothetical protein